MSKELELVRKALQRSQPKFLAVVGNEKIFLREAGFAYQIIQKSESLQKCSATSIVDAIVNIARTGITLNPVLRLAYLIPRKGECVLDISYMGLIEILTGSKAIKSISAHIVYNDDEFEDQTGSTGLVIHKPKFVYEKAEQDKRIKIAVFSRATLQDGTVVYHVLKKWQVEKIKAVSTGKDTNSSPWKLWEEEQWLKTAIKSHYKYLPKGHATDNIAAALEVLLKNEDIDPLNIPQENKQKIDIANLFADEETEQPKKQQEKPKAIDNNAENKVQFTTTEAVKEKKTNQEISEVKVSGKTLTSEQEQEYNPFNDKDATKTAAVPLPKEIEEDLKEYNRRVQEKQESLKVKFEKCTGKQELLRLMIKDTEFNFTDEDVTLATEQYKPVNRHYESKKSLIDHEEDRGFILSVLLDIITFKEQTI